MRQVEMKRFLAYSSISQMGFLLMGLCGAGKIATYDPNAAINSWGYMGMLNYIMIYTVMNVGSFYVVHIVETHTGSTKIEAFRGLIKRAPATGYTLLVCLISLAGIPPLAGFFAKFFVFVPAIESGLYALAIWAAINAIISAYYYFRIVRIISLTEPETRTMILPGALQRFGLIAPFAFLTFYFVGGKLATWFFGYAAGSFFLTVNVYFGAGPSG
jgi:NADH:ubiquinone oxidoreductase subunit 2 (subunit N)